MIGSNEKITYRNSNGLPPTVCIELTKWCNLKCSYCRSSSSPKEYLNGISFSEISSYLKELKKYGDWRISLTGGEPTYWPNLKELIELIIELDFSFCITTNGYSSNHLFEIISFDQWKKGTLKVSIDGDLEVHNSLRGKKSYERALKFLLTARGIVPRLFVNTVLVSDPKSWAKNILNDIGPIKLNNWTIISPIRSGAWIFELEELNKINYSEQYMWIKQLVDKSIFDISVSFLDYAKWNNEYQGVVYISSDGNIAVPKYFIDDLNNIEINISDKNSAYNSYKSVSSFIEKNGFVK